ncbi:hypothetical protein ACFORH_42810 [Amycolatopsis roodepoortensis]|uniref:Uncharacterized protein n=1 Tax=Amycolatopsis roodepoortensis TaxID=700274 RepID=A0ABR9L4F8_9PSEU|nr:MULTISPECIES: hypothetical protein [Amycolatopsis]MBE1575023.1 hypothetical protein [Amycolatopsis roodepoortensis]GHG97444.1 hypothetical protein GCM10017788_76950 [Amycolatopsis acidiphila]
MKTEDKPLHVRQAEALRRQAEGLRRLADMVEAHPEIQAYYLKPDEPITMTAWYATSPAELTAIMRAARQHKAKVEKDAFDDVYQLKVSWDGLTVAALANRGEVCERVVTGTETVTKTVPDPVKLAEVPTVEVTETVDKVEWVCRPLLAAEKAPAVTA